MEHQLPKGSKQGHSTAQAKVFGWVQLVSTQTQTCCVTQAAQHSFVLALCAAWSCFSAVEPHKQDKQAGKHGIDGDMPIHEEHACHTKQARHCGHATTCVLDKAYLLKRDGERNLVGRVPLMQREMPCMLYGLAVDCRQAASLSKR
jgi:hypothetical protein